MEDFDIERVVDDFAAATARIRAAGFDGLEFLHTGHLVDYFFASRSNDRADEYNGDLAARLRFPLRIIDAMRAAADGLALGGRMPVRQQVADGLTEGLAVEALSEYAAHGIDVLNLSVGTISSDRELAEAIPGMGTPSAPWLETCRRIREAI